MKTLLMTVSVASMLAVAPAFAQTSTPSGDPPSLPTVPEASATTKQSVSMGEHRLSTLMKATVKNAGGETVGTINDALLDKSGRVTHYVVGVGGFLGIGERNVALPFDEIRISRDANNSVVVATSVPKETLSQLPEWKDPAAASRTPASAPATRTAPQSGKSTQ